MQDWHFARQRADLFKANISANKISLLQGQSYNEGKYYKGSNNLNFKNTQMVND